MSNIPEVKLGLIAVSRDCFVISLSERRRGEVPALLEVHRRHRLRRAASLPVRPVRCGDRRINSF